jgi:ATP-binding cassette subfamily F protein uup
VKAPSPEAKTFERAGKLSYKLQLELDALPEKIEVLETKVAELEARAAAPDFYTKPFAEVEPVLNEIASTKRALEEILERWIVLEGMQSDA